MSGGPRRNRPGSGAADWCSWDDQELNDMDGTLASHQYLQQLLRKDPGDTDTICETPEGHDPLVWIYDHLRQFVIELNALAVVLSDVCTCSKMKVRISASSEEYIYRCAAHRSAIECCAMDYIVHNLDGTSCLLNSQKLFPSRISIQDGSVQYFGPTTRRLYRVFAHTYFHHRDVFSEFEARTHLCERFVKFVEKNQLIPSDLLIIPKSAFTSSEE